MVRGFTIVIALVWIVAAPTLAFAKPRLAVMPIKNDDEAAEAIADALSDSANIIPAAKVTEAREKLGLPEGFLERPDLVRLQTKLRASVVVQGKVKKDGANRTLVGTVSVRGKKDASFTVEFKKTGSEKFKKGVRDELAKRIAGAEEIKDEPEARPEKKSDPEKKPDKKKVAEAPDEGPKKMLKRKKKEEPKKADPPAKKKKEEPVAAENKPKKKKKKVATSEDPDPDPPKKKKKKKKAAAATADPDTITEVGDTDDATPRDVMLSPAVRFDVGMSGGVRQLRYQGGGAAGPPPLGTGAPGARFEGELYPLAFSNASSAGAGLGIAAEFDKTVNLSILAPGTNTSIGVDQGRWSIGARYRFNLGPSATLGLGVDYARRHYTIERGMIVLDAPNVDYTSVNPGAYLRASVAPTVALFAHAGGMLIMNTGPIQTNEEYGKATVLGFGGEAGIDIALGTKFALRIAGEYNQINFDFTGNGANSRGVTAATDRQFGAVATIGLVY